MTLFSRCGYTYLKLRSWVVDRGRSFLLCVDTFLEPNCHLSDERLYLMSDISQQILEIDFDGLDTLRLYEVSIICTYTTIHS